MKIISMLKLKKWSLEGAKDVYKRQEYVKGLMKLKEKMIKMQKNITNLLPLAKSFDFSN